MHRSIMDKLLEQIKNKPNQALGLLRQAQNMLTNQIGDCEKSSCTVEIPCRNCSLCRKVYDDIEKYLKG